MRDAGRDGTPEEVLSAVIDDLSCDVTPSETVVSGSLDEILLALVALRDDETHGTGLMEDMGRLFDVQPSPGTIYPRLHELDEAGTLSRHDLVQTKQYSIADHERAADRLERAMYQHLTVGLFLRSALAAVDSP